MTGRRRRHDGPAAAGTRLFDIDWLTRFSEKRHRLALGRLVRANDVRVGRVARAGGRGRAEQRARRLHGQGMNAVAAVRVEIGRLRRRHAGDQFFHRLRAHAAAAVAAVATQASAPARHRARVAARRRAGRRLLPGRAHHHRGRRGGVREEVLRLLEQFLRLDADARVRQRVPLLAALLLRHGLEVGGGRGDGGLQLFGPVRFRFEHVAVLFDGRRAGRALPGARVRVLGVGLVRVGATQQRFGGQLFLLRFDFAGRVLRCGHALGAAPLVHRFFAAALRRLDVLEQFVNALTTDNPIKAGRLIDSE